MDSVAIATRHSGGGGVKKIKVLFSNVFCAKCDQFLGMTCDPFRPEYCEECEVKEQEKQEARGDDTSKTP